MGTRIGRVPSAGRRRAGRPATALVAAVLVTGGTAACSGAPAGQDVGGVTAEELQQVEDELAGLDDRVAALESDAGTGTATPTETPTEAGSDAGTVQTDAGTAAFLADSRSYVGREVTISAEISELVTTTDLGSSFRIAGGSGNPVAVVVAAQPMELDTGDVVRISGTVAEVRADTFEQDFGIVAEELFEDASAWLSEEEGSVAISAGRVEVLPEQGRRPLARPGAPR